MSLFDLDLHMEDACLLSVSACLNASIMDKLLNVVRNGFSNCNYAVIGR